MRHTVLTTTELRALGVISIAMRLVILTLAGWEVGGRDGRYLCSCGLAAAGRPCDHVRAVVATLPAEPPAAA